MSKRTGIVRAFDGSLADARGLLQIERATFNESPYAAEDVRDMLSTGPQQAWLAIARDKVVGFVIAFPTHSLSGARWEIDVLAVHPDCAGRGLGTRLIRTAAAHGVGAARRARAVVAAGNPASARAFTQAGFRMARGLYNLLIYRTQGLSPEAPAAWDATVREATCVAEEDEWLAAFPPPRAAPLVPAGLQPLSTNGLDCEAAVVQQVGKASSERTLLLVEQGGGPAGYAELVPVQTLLYRGEWIETLVAPDRTARGALVDASVIRAESAGLDEVGAMVPEDNKLLRKVFLDGGFQSVGDFNWLVAELPLPGWAASSRTSPTAIDTSGGDGV